MPRTPGTRPKGSGIPAGGSGWGGPKRGDGAPQFGAGNPEVERALQSLGGSRAPGEGKAARSREALEAAQPIAIRTVLEIAADKGDQRALAAALAILNRTGLHEKSGVEVAGEGGGPLIVERVIVNPPDRDPEGV